LSGRLAHALATVGGLGDRLPAPGTTVGSLAGAGLFAATAWSAPHLLVPASLVGFAALAAAAVWACGAEAARRGIEDPGPVVLDEVAGQWLALTAVTLVRAAPPTLGVTVASFFLFRLFDVLKPWPIRHLERLPGGWGITADDLAAGLAAGLVQIALMLIPKAP
jgi:phosphatidylglycerophosphatase A